MSPRQCADLLMLSVPPTRPLPCTRPDTMSGPRVSTSPTTVELSEITVGDMPSRSASLRLGSSVMATPRCWASTMSRLHSVVCIKSSLGIITMSARALVIVFAVSLLSLSGCSREKNDWRSAQAADTAESYQQFIDSHPDSTLLTSARARLTQLAEEKDWRVAAQVDTLDAYRKFLAQYPQGHWAKEAQVRIDAFASSAGAGSSAVAPENGAAAATSAAPAGDSPAGAGAVL